MRREAEAQGLCSCTWRVRPLLSTDWWTCVNQTGVRLTLRTNTVRLRVTQHTRLKMNLTAETHYCKIPSSIGDLQRDWRRSASFVMLRNIFIQFMQCFFLWIIIKQTKDTCPGLGEYLVLWGHGEMLMTPILSKSTVIKAALTADALFLGEIMFDLCFYVTFKLRQAYSRVLCSRGDQCCSLSITNSVMMCLTVRSWTTWTLNVVH